jgi:hypothetical protein
MILVNNIKIKYSYTIYKSKMDFSSQDAPENKNFIKKVGKVAQKVLPVAQKVLPVAATFIPALAPVATVVGAIRK